MTKYYNDSQKQLSIGIDFHIKNIIEQIYFDVKAATLEFPRGPWGTGCI